MNEEMKTLIWKLWWLMDVVVEKTEDTVFFGDDSLHEVFANLVSEVDPQLAATLFADLENGDSSRPAGLFEAEE